MLTLGGCDEGVFALLKELCHILVVSYSLNFVSSQPLLTCEKWK